MAEVENIVNENLEKNEGTTVPAAEHAEATSTAAPAAEHTEATGAAPAATRTVEMSELEQLLAKYGATPEVTKAVIGLGLTGIDDLKYLREEELMKAGMNLIQSRKLVASLKSEPESQPSAAPTAPPAAKNPSTTNILTDSVLPTIPGDDTWLNILKTGGVLKVDQATYIAAVRAAIAGRVKIYDIPKKLVHALEEYSKELDEPVGPEFFKLMKQLTRRNYGELFAAIDGVDGTFVSEHRKMELLKRIDDYLWPAVTQCYQQLNAWQQAWVNGLTPGVLAASYYGGAGGLAGGLMPSSMAQIPDISPLQDVGDTLRDALNKALSGTGSVVASAIAYDYSQIRAVLEDPTLPAKIGAGNREQMYKRLGVAVDASMVRAEASIVRFIISFAQNDRVTSDAAPNYYNALFMLGSQINWAQLGLKPQTADNTNGSGIKNLSGDEL